MKIPPEEVIFNENGYSALEGGTLDSNQIITEYFDTFTEERFRFSKEEVDILMEGGTSITLKKGETLYNVGDPNEYVYYLLKGKVKYHMIYPDGASQTTAFSQAASIVGVMNLNPAQTAVNCCTAITTCEFRAIPIGVFMRRVQENNLVEQALHFFIGASRHIYLNLLALHTGNRIMLAYTLRGKYKLSLQETAEYIGCSRVHVSRLLKQYHEKTQTNFPSK